MMTKMLDNRYEIIKKIGEGGMAVVYLAKDHVNKRDVAIKIIKEDIADFETNKLRFDREARTIAYLMHPNIIQIYDIGEDNGLPFIVMEYIESTSLKNILTKRCNLGLKETIDIMLQLTTAVQHAHSNNVLHRDIKPQNILIRVDNVVKLGDFGIAVFENAPPITEKDAVMGSVHYLAPEVIQGNKATPQSDIYQLGITFFEMLTGKLPFDGENSVAVAMKHIKERMPSVRKINSQVPIEVEKIIKKACAKERYGRYSSAKEMYEDILKLDLNTKKKKLFGIFGSRGK